MDLYRLFLETIALIYSLAAAMIVTAIPLLIIIAVAAMFSKTVRRLIFGKKTKKA